MSATKTTSIPGEWNVYVEDDEDTPDILSCEYGCEEVISAPVSDSVEVEMSPTKTTSIPGEWNVYVEEDEDTLDILHCEDGCEEVIIDPVSDSPVETTKPGGLALAYLII
jgi:hypothetical protein